MKTSKPTASTVAPNFRQRRQKILQAMQKEGGGVSIFFSGSSLRRSRDTHFPYRWDSDFYYLCGFPEPDAALVLVADNNNSSATLFCQPHEETHAIWVGSRIGPAQACLQFDVDRALPFTSLSEEMTRLLSEKSIFWKIFGDAYNARETVEEHYKVWRASLFEKKKNPPTQIRDLSPILGEMRLIKDPLEQELMKKAADISVAAHLRAIQATRPGLSEFEIEAELLYEFRRHNACPAYNSIVAAGENSCVLHYSENQGPLRSGDLLLIDAACEIEGYCADITRTFPVNGRFSGPQKDLYNIVLEAQTAAIACVRPGACVGAPHQAAVRILTQGLIDHGLLKGSIEEAISTESYKKFYMHRTSHWLGMDVHDCGSYNMPDTSTPTRRSLRTFSTGMVLTIEPGLYIRPSEDIPREYHNIGIRIEDDLLVTEHGVCVLTEAVPKKPEALESHMHT